MKRGTRWSLGIGAAIVLLAGGLAARPKKPLLVDVQSVLRGTMEERVSSAASGDVEPGAKATFRAETVARVVTVETKPGARVEAGAVLLRLDDRALAAATAAARVQKETAERDHATAEAMQKKGIVTEQAVLGARAARDLARANLSVAEANLARAVVRAPFAGLVARLPVQEGDSVVVGQALGEVVDDRVLYVRAAFDEVDAVRIREGDEALVRLDAYPDAPLPARVERVDPVVGGDSLGGGDASSMLPLGGKKDRTVGIRVALASAPPASMRILVGMSADVEVVLSRIEGVLRVPSAAILQDKGKPYAWVLDSGRIRRRDVKTGLSNWEMVEVKNGLTEGEEVVVSLETEGIVNGANAKRRETFPPPADEKRPERPRTPTPSL